MRYSLNALLCLEMTYKSLNEILAIPYREWGMEDVIQLVHAAMCGMPWNRKAVNRRDFEFVRPTVGELGEKIRMEDLPRLRTELLGAILDSMPDKKTEENTASQVTDKGHIFAVADKSTAGVVRIYCGSARYTCRASDRPTVQQCFDSTSATGNYHLVLGNE